MNVRLPSCLRLSPLLLVTALGCASPHGGGAADWHEPDWRGFQRADLPAGWRAEAGVLTFTPGVEDGGGDIVTTDQYGDFELDLEWRITRAGNSGIFFRVLEGDHDAVWRTGAEMQVLDNDEHADGRDPLTSAGANYALHRPSRDVTRPVGEWNRARLIVRGANVEHWLNDQKLLEYELWSPEWEALVAASKFASMPDYGRAERGHIALQDHGDVVSYRNIRVREL